MNNKRLTLGPLQGYSNINVGGAIEELHQDWLNITLWGDPINGTTCTEVVNGINIYEHDDQLGDMINYDVTKGLPLEDSSISTIFTSHFIEHLNFYQAQQFFKECSRVLKPEGIIRIICPDIDIWVEKLYKQEDKAFFDAYDNAISVDVHGNNYYHARKSFTDPTQLFNSMMYSWGHKWMWNFNTLKQQLNDNNIGNVTRKSFLDSDIPNIEAIENRLEPRVIANRNLESIFLEGKKNVSTNTTREASTRQLI